MNVLVTGANGFLGRHVVAALVRRGHSVRAMVRPAAAIPVQLTSARVEVVRQDLRRPSALVEALAGIDVLVHLAAATSGDDESQFVSTVVGTERLLEAMKSAGTTRLVLCSSFSVYDFSKACRRLSEDTPLEGDIYHRDGYAIAKWWQERIVREVARERGWALTVLRPGFIWGPGHEYLACLGQRAGPGHLAIAPLARLPLTYVENCADCFATATQSPKAAGQTYNVVDSDDVRAWRYLGEYIRRSGHRGFRVPVPYWLWMTLARFADLTSRLLFKGRGKVPSIFMPRRFQARFKPLRYSTDRLRNDLGWTPPFSFDQCLARTYGEKSGAPDAQPLMQPQVNRA